jgi:hypothetical protein
MSESVLDRDSSILCNAARLDADGFGAAVVPKTDRAMLDVPAGVDLTAGLAHKAQCTNVGAGLTELS